MWEGEARAKPVKVIYKALEGREERIMFWGKKGRGLKGLMEVREISIPKNVMTGISCNL